MELKLTQNSCKLQLYKREERYYICLFFFSLKNTKYFNIHTEGEGEKILKKLIMVYIQKDLTLVYPKKINRHIICLFRNNLFSSLLKIFG